MNGKVLLLAFGVGVGFLLGSRAGREPYEKLAAAVSKVWHDPRVQTQVDRTQAFVNDRVDDAVEIATTATKNLVDRVTSPKPARKPAKKPTGA